VERNREHDRVSFLPFLLLLLLPGIYIIYRAIIVSSNRILAPGSDHRSFELCCSLLWLLIVIK